MPDTFHILREAKGLNKSDKIGNRLKEHLAEVIKTNSKQGVGEGNGEMSREALPPCDCWLLAFPLK